MLDILFCEHLTHVGTARRVTDHGCAAAYKCNGSVARLLKAFHERERHEMAGSEAVSSTVKADVELRFA